MPTENTDVDRLFCVVTVSFFVWDVYFIQVNVWVNVWVVATQIFFMFTPKIGEDFHPF